MSFEINWESLGEDPIVNNSIKDFLNSHLQSISLPSYVGSLRVTDFCLGCTPPKITLREISNPLEEFYEHISNERLADEIEASSSNLRGEDHFHGENDDSGKDEKDSDSDLQFLVEIDYKGDMLITVSAELALNYPSPHFMTLPVKLTISDLGMHALCLVAYLSKQLFIS